MTETPLSSYTELLLRAGSRESEAVAQPQWAVTGLGGGPALSQGPESDEVTEHLRSLTDKQTVQLWAWLPLQCLLSKIRERKGRVQKAAAPSMLK